MSTRSIDQTAKVHPSVHIDETVTIHAFSIISRNAVIGRNTKIGHNCFVGPGVEIGSNCLIQGNCFIPAGITIANDCFIGPGVTFCNVKHPPLPAKMKGSYEKTFIGYGCSIGAGSTILPGLHIVPLTSMGAGTVMTKSSKQVGETYVGNPSRVFRTNIFKWIWKEMMKPTSDTGPKP